jgi:hypothetical protein
MEALGMRCHWCYIIGRHGGWNAVVAMVCDSGMDGNGRFLLTKWADRMGIEKLLRLSGDRSGN